MTIVTSLTCFEGYAPKSLAADAESRIAACHAAMTANRGVTSLVLLFEAYLQLTRQTCTVEDLVDPASRTRLATSFAAALYSSRFKSHGHWNGPYRRAARFFKLIECAFGKLEPMPTLGTNGDPTESLKPMVEEFEAADLDPDRLRFWQGWIGHNRNGSPCHFKFAALYDRLGHEFTERLFIACCDALARGAARTVPCMNDFAAFIACKPDVRTSDFQDPARVEDVLQNFFQAYFREIYERGGKISVALCRWRHFATSLSSHVLGHIWAEPYGGIPLPKVESLPGVRTNVRKTQNGYEVKHTLITPIPLSVSDSEAKDLLFGDIQREAGYIRNWANREIDEIWHRHQRRLSLAPEGEVALVGKKGSPNGAGWRISRDNPDCLKHAAATFEARGITPCADSKVRHVSLIYPRPLTELYIDLGLPTQCHFMAHAAILILEHPEITPSFLEGLELYDTKGRLVGLEELDGGTYLVGAKPRKTPGLAQQRIQLNVRTEQIVRQAIELTTHLRACLRERNDKRWRRLFLVSSTVAAVPSAWRSSLLAQYQPWLADRFTSVLSIDHSYAVDLASRFGLKRVRATAGVLVYLQTGSVQKMADTLGHTRWKPKLLDHYLPRPIQEFFTERWVRIVQEGLIVEAMKESPQLLEATSFNSVDELDTFLETHAFRTPSSYLVDPDGVSASDRPVESKQVLIGLDRPVMTLLLSIQKAVGDSISPLPGRMQHWAKFAEHVSDYIREAGRPDLSELLDESMRDASADRLKEVICA